MKPGYKQTEVGVIPEDWKVQKLKKLITIRSGESPSNFSISETGIPFYKVEQLNNSIKYQKNTPYFVKVENPVAAGSIIFPKRGAAIFLNKIRIITQDSYFDTNIMSLTPTSEIHNEFLYYMLSYIDVSKLADTTSVPQINNKHINPCQVAYPTLMQEQKTISKVLSDIDSLIASLEKLIEKKKLIKQGVMQELLTGKRRLPGFNGEWETKKFGECFLMYYGKPMKESDRSNSSRIPVYGSNGVVGYTSQALTSGPTIIIGRKGAAGLVHHSVTECWPIDTTFYIEFTDRTDSLFYYYLLQLVGLHKIKSDSAVPGINRADAYAVKISVPPQEERYQIAEFLVTLDTELASLTRNLDKYKYLKQAMMQELLTGRIRLI